MFTSTFRAAGVAVWLFSTTALAGQTFVSVEWPRTAAARETRDALLRAGTLEKLVEVADRYTLLRGELGVNVGHAPKSGFDPTTNTIVLSYRHWQSVVRRATAVGHFAEGQSLGTLADDAMMYSAIHLLAHAIMAQQDPATQRLGDDAVSDLATVILLEFVPDGARIAQNAMYLYDDTIAVAGEDSYWLEHGHSIERVWSGTCHRGADTGGDDRAVCQGNYNQMVASWASVFEPEQAERMLKTASR
ncbi:MAG: DUF4344 domain-containing metallopeptidase [Pseudomonadota bacterium]